MLEGYPNKISVHDVICSCIFGTVTFNKGTSVDVNDNVKFCTGVYFGHVNVYIETIFVAKWFDVQSK